MRKLLSAFINGVLEIRYHVLRSALSLIGIVLGVMNLSAMFSIIEGAQMASRVMLDSMGTPDLVSVNLDWKKLRKAVEWKNFRLTWDDVDNIRKYAATVKAVGVEVYRHEDTQYEDKNVRYTIVGVMPSSFDMNKYTLEKGRMITDYDMENRSRVCVIGSEPRNDLFGKKDPVGQKIRIRGEYYQVIGLLDEFGKYWEVEEKNKKSSSGGRRSGLGGMSSGNRNPLEWKNRRILIPATTMQTRLIGEQSGGGWFAISAQSKSVDLVNATMEEVRNILIKTHDDQDVFDVRSMVEWQGERNDILRLWQILLGIVAGISLAVGGVGIMNVMLASFRERLREIGIRKAIGATNTDIFLLFIVETIVICLIGGIIGLAIGYAISMTALRSMLVDMMQVKAEFSVGAGLFAILFSMIIGLLSGLYPAIKAAKLPPVEALRYE